MTYFNITSFQISDGESDIYRSDEDDDRLRIEQDEDSGGVDNGGVRVWNQKRKAEIVKGM